MTTAIGRGFARVRLQQGAEAEEAFAEATALVDATDDVLDQAITWLACGIGLDALGHADGVATLASARNRLAAIGIDAHGWENAFRLAAGS